MINISKLFTKDKDDDGTRYVVDVDVGGLNVLTQPNGRKTGRILYAGEKVIVSENTGYWSCIGGSRWIWSFNLSKNKPKNLKVVSGKGLVNAKVKVFPSDDSYEINEIPVGTPVQVYKRKGKYSCVSKDYDMWVLSKHLK